MEYQSTALDELKALFDVLEINVLKMNNLFSDIKIQLSYFRYDDSNIPITNIKTTDIGKALLMCRLNNFKKGEKIFDIIKYLTVHFSEYFYQIKLSNTVLLQKYYDERILAIEQETVVKAFLESILKDIEQHIK